jgi:acyl dehydratase
MPASARTRSPVSGLVLYGVVAAIHTWLVTTRSRLMTTLYRLLTEDDTFGLLPQGEPRACRRVGASRRSGHVLRCGARRHPLRPGRHQGGRGGLFPRPQARRSVRCPRTRHPSTKTNPGRFFEDYTVGDVIEHAVPRTVSGGERALYHALYPARHALYSSDEFARPAACRKARSTICRVSHRLRQIGAGCLAERGGQPRLCRGALAAPGLCRRHDPVVVRGDRAEAELLGKTGVVYVRTTGRNQHGLAVMEFARWVMVRKRDLTRPRPTRWCPTWRPRCAPICW